MPQLHKYAAVCGEIQPADGSPPALALRPLSAGSPGGDRLRVLCSRGARACRTHAWSALLAAVVLAALAWGGSRLAAARQRELAQWLEYVPARQAEPAHGAAEAAVQAAAAQRPLPQCTLQLDGSPWERHCQRLRRVCVDQGQLILYEDRWVLGLRLRFGLGPGSRTRARRASLRFLFHAPPHTPVTPATAAGTSNWMGVVPAACLS